MPGGLGHLLQLQFAEEMKVQVQQSRGRYRNRLWVIGTKEEASQEQVCVIKIKC